MYHNDKNATIKICRANKLGIQAIANLTKEGLDSKKTKAFVPVNPFPKILQRPIEAFSEQMDMHVPGLGFAGKKFGSAVIITAPPEGTSVQNDVDMVVGSNRGINGGPNIVVSVGRIREVASTDGEKANKRGGMFSSGRASSGAKSVTVLPISIMIDCPAANIATSRKFAERVKELFEDPIRLIRNESITD
jgi:hypothetical protein